MRHVVADPTEEGPVPAEAEPLSLRLELALVRAAAGYEEAHIPDLLDHAGKRVERELESLLVHQPTDQEHELLVRRGELPTQLAQIAARPQVAGVDAVGYDGDP